MRATLAESWQDTPPPSELASASPPHINTEPVPNCAICDCARFEHYTVGFDYELGTCINPWRFVRCGECHHVWLHPRPAIEALGLIYPPTYYAYNYEKVSPIALKGKELLDKRRMKKILAQLDQPPISYLDIGCGNGRYLKVLEKKGLARSSLYGLELDEDVVSSLAEAGYLVFCERVEETDRFPEESIDLVTMFHVIEHVGDPRAVVERIAGWLAPGGLFAIETPNIESIDARWFRESYWGGYHIPRHWHLFTPNSLSRLLTNAGLKVTAIEYQTGHSFMYSHHRIRYRERTPRPRLARLVRSDEQRRAPRPLHRIRQIAGCARRPHVGNARIGGKGPMTSVQA